MRVGICCGIKFTPLGHVANPSLEDGMHVFEVVSSFDASVMAHMGMGFSFAHPVNIYLMAKSFPDVRIAIAHPGENFSTQ